MPSEKHPNRKRPNALPYNAQTLYLLANEIDRHATLLRTAAKLVEEQLGDGQAIRLNYSNAVATGLLAIRDMVRNIDQKLDKKEFVQTSVQAPDFINSGAPKNAPKAAE